MLSFSLETSPITDSDTAKRTVFQRSYSVVASEYDKQHSPSPARVKAVPRRRVHSGDAGNDTWSFQKWYLKGKLCGCPVLMVNVVDGSIKLLSVCVIVTEKAEYCCSHCLHVPRCITCELLAPIAVTSLIAYGCLKLTLLAKIQCDFCCWNWASMQYKLGEHRSSVFESNDSAGCRKNNRFYSCRLSPLSRYCRH